MKRPKPLQATLMATPDDIEAQFYEALHQGDIEKLMAVWADEDDIACAHPGGSRVHGHAAVRSVFETLFAQGGVAAHPLQVRRTACGGAAAIHHVLQSVAVQTAKGPDTACMLVTNVYVKTSRGWRLLVHHASHGTADELEAPAERGAALLH